MLNRIYILIVSRYNLSVLEVKPGNAVTIIECDMSVEFATPIGYTHPEPERPKEDDEVYFHL